MGVYLPHRSARLRSLRSKKTRDRQVVRNGSRAANRVVESTDLHHTPCHYLSGRGFSSVFYDMLLIINNYDKLIYSSAYHVKSCDLVCECVCVCIIY